MATTTKSPRKRTTKTTKTAKSSKKVAVSTKTANSKPKTAAKAVLSPLDRLRSVHVSTALVYLVFAGLVLGFVKTAAQSVSLDIQARNLLSGTNNVVLGPAYEVLYNIEPKHLLVASLLLSALASVLFATKLRDRYAAGVSNRASGLRWAALGISSAVLFNYVAMLAGVHDFAVLKLSGALIFVTTILSWLAERENVGLATPRWGAFNLSLLTGALAWLPVFGSLIGTTLFGMERFGWHVYALVAVTLLGFSAFAISLYRHIRPNGIQRDYVASEAGYMRIDLFTKFAVVLITIIALQ